MAKKRKKPLDVVLPKPVIPEQRVKATPTKQYEQPIGPQQPQPTIQRGVDPTTGRGYTIERGVRYDDDVVQPQTKVIMGEEGKAVGVEKGGQTYLGLGKKDIAKMAPEGTPTAEEVARQENIQRIIGQIGEGVEVPVGTEQKIDVGEAITAGLARGLPSTAVGIGTAALAGTKIGAAGGPWGMAAGAALGAAYGIWRGIQGNIEQQQKGQVGAIMVDYNQGLRNLRTLAMLATTYPEHAEGFVEDFNTQKYLIMRAHANLKAETDENLEKYIEDGTVNLAKFDAVLAPNGLIATYETRLGLALSRGVPMIDMAEELKMMEVEIPE